MRYLKFFIGFLLFVTIPFLFVYIDRSLHSKDISIATGGKGGGYYAFAQKYKKILKKDGVNLKIITTAGSIEAQRMLLQGKVNYAFVQGGTEIKDQGLSALANIAYEPIWVFCNDKNITSLRNLMGKHIAIGTKGSGIYPVAKDLLNGVGINANNSTFLHLNSKDASSALQNKTIDAMVYISSANSKLVDKLLKIGDISLLDFADAHTFKQYFLNKNKDFEILTLEAGSLSLKKYIPHTTHTLLSVKTLIATVKNTDETLTRLLMKAIEQTHHKAGLFQKENTFPNTIMLTFKQDIASSKYFTERENFYEKNFDFWTAQSLSKLHNFTILYFLPILMLFGFFIEVIIPTLDLYSSRKITMWYDRINAIDTGIEHLDLKEAKIKKDILENMLHEVRSKDDIPTSHMEAFYTLQNQITNISNDIQKRIDKLTKKSFES